MKKTVLLVLHLFLLSPVFGQSQTILDSLEQVYQGATHDTTRILTLCQIGSQYQQHYPDTSLYLWQQALQESERIEYLRGQGLSLNRIGDYHRS